MHLPLFKLTGIIIHSFFPELKVFGILISIESK